MTAPVRAASLLLFLALIALGGGLLALHFASEHLRPRPRTAPYRINPRDCPPRRPTTALT